MKEFRVSPVTALVIDGEAAELKEQHKAVFELFDIDPRYAVITAIVLEDCLNLWDDRQAFQIRVAGWRDAAREFAARWDDE